MLTTLHVPIILKSGSLNFLGISGPVEACNGIVFLLTFSVGIAPLPQDKIEAIKQQSRLYASISLGALIVMERQKVLLVCQL
jgi:hypothetical protein